MTEKISMITLPRFISDGMILQRNADVRIWGWAPACECISIHFLGKVFLVSANEASKWEASIPTGNAGGPYEMIIKAENDTEPCILKDILLGDVWLCSGQSNMEMKMEAVKEVYKKEIEESHNPLIRQFIVPVTFDFDGPRENVSESTWEAANPVNVLNFSAAGYFFALKLYEKYHIPIGLINASLGGSPAEAWLSEEALLQFPYYLETAKKWRNKSYLEAVLKENEDSFQEWHQLIDQKDIGMPDRGLSCFDTAYDASGWSVIKVPSYWEEEGLGHFNGAVWFRKEIDISSELLDKPARLLLGNIVDEDAVYVNGRLVGSLPMQYVSRKYNIPKDVLKPGINVIVVRVVNQSGRGGFYKGKPYLLEFGDVTIDLCGDWQYMIGVKSKPMKPPVFVMWQPTGLYNGMIAPIIKYSLKGVLWYQGETNAQNPENYESLLKALIADWRAKKGMDLPFLYVQLPNFSEPSDSPAASNWALIREAQRRTLEVPGTGMAVTIDIGEWNDVHPVNKKDVGNRLVLVALKTAYGEAVAAFPLFRSALREENKMILSFYNRGSGLVTIDGKTPGPFAIAGKDKVYYPAASEFRGDCIVVWNDQVKEPVHVRYAWADNPAGVNLYNKEGLPASPFSGDCTE